MRKRGGEKRREYERHRYIYIERERERERESARVERGSVCAYRGRGACALGGKT